MTAEVIRGADFAGLHRYLTSTVKHLGPEDIELLNLVSLETAVVEMKMNAWRSARVQMPVYHLILT